MSKANKVLWGIIVIVIILLIIILGRDTKAPVVGDNVEGETIKIGLVGHFSGEYATYGVPMKNAIELALEKTENIDKYELIVEDDAGDQTNATSAMNKLINIDQVKYIISAQGSGATSAIAPISQNNGRILMITLGSAPDITKVGEYIFRSVPSDVYQGVEIAKFIDNNLEAVKVASLYVNDAYGVGIKNLIKERIKTELGIQEMFEVGSADFRTQLLKIKSDGADALVLVSRKETPIILKQIKELGLNLKIIASETVKDDEIIKESQDSAEGIFVAFTEQPKDYINFVDDYTTKFNEVPSAYSMYAYDGATALIEAIKKGENEIEKVKKGLLEVDFNGASGQFSFDDDRERKDMNYTIYEVKDGEFVPYESK